MSMPSTHFSATKLTGLRTARLNRRKPRSRTRSASVYIDGGLAGFGRVVSDFATFAYVGDVFVLPEFRGRGLSKRLMQAMVDHPQLQGLRRWLRGDAHSLYEQYEFASLRHPERWMEHGTGRTEESGRWSVVSGRWAMQWAGIGVGESGESA